MEILDNQTDKVSLLRLTAEAVGLLASSNFDALAHRFGYALAYGRDRSTAIRDDLQVYLEEFGCSALAPGTGPPDASVQYFKPNNTGLLAAVDCLVPTNNGSKVLVSLVATSRGAGTYFTLEGFAPAA